MFPTDGGWEPPRDPMQFMRIAIDKRVSAWAFAVVMVTLVTFVLFGIWIGNLITGGPVFVWFVRWLVFFLLDRIVLNRFVQVFRQVKEEDDEAPLSE